MGNNGNPDEFDPTKDDGFLKNLEKTLESSDYGGCHHVHPHHRGRWEK